MTNNKKQGFYWEMLHIGVPITLQSIFAASFSVIDQLMVGQLGTTSIAAGGLGGKFASLFMVSITAVGTVASILISQFYGKRDNKGIGKSFAINLLLGLVIAGIFTTITMLIPSQISALYTNDIPTCTAAASYLQIVAVGFFPYALTLMMSSHLRSVGYSRYPMIAGIVSVIVNIFGNYVLIFGMLGFPKMGLNGAAIATTISKFAETLVIFILYLKYRHKEGFHQGIITIPDKSFLKKTLLILAPLLLTEFSWGLGENIYAVVYGRIGADALAAMTLTNPVQGMLVGMFTGVSSAAAVMIGNRLGRNQFEQGYRDSKRFMRIALMGGIILGGILALTAPLYAGLFNVEDDIKITSTYILYGFASVLFVKILNMTLGGGILRSGGNTKYTLIIDAIGTWIVGIPLGLLTAYVFQLPVYWVYFILSMEECVRLILSLIVFKRKKWMKNLT